MKRTLGMIDERLDQHFYTAVNNIINNNKKDRFIQ